MMFLCWQEAVEKAATAAHDLKIVQHKLSRGMAKIITQGIALSLASPACGLYRARSSMTRY